MAETTISPGVLPSPLSLAIARIYIHYKDFAPS
ncbi:MAG: hypothetical protein RIR86_944 [Acidobacteriota bacterium]